LSYTKKPEFNRLDVIAFNYRSLFAGTVETFVVHLDLTPTKRPKCTHKNATLSGDLVVLKIDHCRNRAMIKTAISMTAPTSRPAIIPQRSAYAM
jgi:hypothetical protein